MTKNIIIAILSAGVIWYVYANFNNKFSIPSIPNVYYDSIDDIKAVIKDPESTTWGELAGANSGDMDEKMTVKKIHSGRKNKSAIDGFSRNMQKSGFEKYYDKEMRENEQRVWYSEEASNLL